MTRLDEIAARAEAATGKEWVYREKADDFKEPYIYISPGYFLEPRFADNPVARKFSTPNFKNDCILVAHSRTDIPDLVKALRVAIQDLTSITNIDHGKMKSLAQESLDEIKEILGEK